MKKALKVIIIIFFILLFILASLIGFIYLKKDKIIDYFVNKANNELGFVIKKDKCNLKVDFKKLSIGFKVKNIELASKNESFKINLKSSDFFLIINLIDAIKGIYNIKLIKIQNGKIQLYKTSKNFKKTNNVTKKLITDFGLDKIILKNVEIIHTHDFEYLSDKFNIDNIQGNLNVRGDKLRFEIKGKGRLGGFKYNNNIYMNDVPFKINSILFYNIENDFFSTNNSEVYINNIKVKIKGNITPKKNVKLKTQINIYELKDLLQIVPPHINTKIVKYSPKGKAQLTLNCLGEIKNKQLPQINIGFKLDDIEANIYNLNSNVENLFGNITIPNYKDLSTAKLNAKLKKIQVLKSCLDVNFNIRNLKQFNTHTEIKGNLDGKVIEKVVNTENFSSSGNIYVDLKVINKFKKLPQIIGFYKTKNLKIQYNKGLIEFNTLKIKQNRNTIQVNNFDLNLNNTPIKGSLIFKNLLYITENYNKNTQEEKFPTLNGQIYFKLFSYEMIKSFLNVKSPKEKKINCENNNFLNKYLQKLTSKSIVDINCEIDKIDIFTFSAENIITNLRYRNFFLELINTKFISGGGKVQGYGFYNFNKTNKNLGIKINLKNVGIDNIFKNCNNFGQDFITDKNMQGQVFADINLNVNANDDFLPNWTTIQGKIDAVINSAQLINFEPLQKIKSYLDPDHLKLITAPKISSSVTIKNQKVIVPETKIDCSVTRFKVSGEHNFDNVVNYLLILPMKKNFKKSFEQKTKRQFNYKDEDLQGLKLYLYLKGKAPDLKVSYNITSSVAKELKTQSGHFGKIFIGKFKKKEESQHLANDDVFDFD